jgi:hypothetical protein
MKKALNTFDYNYKSPRDMPQLVKRAQSLNKKKPTTSTWHYERISDDKTLVKEFVIADSFYQL